MFKMNSVDFNNKVALKNLDKLSDKQVFQEWLQRLRDYYITPAEEMNKIQNGLASMILQMCAIDAASSFLSDATHTKDKIKSFCFDMLKSSIDYQLKQAEEIGYGDKITLSEDEIDSITSHLYYQYRCGLVHNGFTLQFGQYSSKNDTEHIFLISYETNDPVLTTYLDSGKKGFIVNPIKFKTMIQYEFSKVQKADVEKREAIGKNIKNSLSLQIQIAKEFRDQ